MHDYVLAVRVGENACAVDRLDLNVCARSELSDADISTCSYPTFHFLVN